MTRRKFKVGDKVVTKKAYGVCPVGSVGEVTFYTNRLYYVTFGAYSSGYYTGVELDAYVEPVKKPAKTKKVEKKETKFKVGDRVRVVSNRSCIEVGKEGTIISIDDTFDPDSDGNLVCVEFKDNIGGHDCGGKGKMGHCWYICDGKLDRVEEPKKEEPKNTIVIYQRDRDVVALDKTTGQKCYAHCHPDDKFDFKTGAKIAFGRLIGEPVKKEPTIEEFEKGKTYIFDKETFLREGGSYCHSWVEECNGKVVQVETSLRGTIHGFGICPWWCKETEYYCGKVVCVKNSIANKNLYTVGKIYNIENGVLITDKGSKITNWHDKAFKSVDELNEFSSSKFIEVVE